MELTREIRDKRIAIARDVLKQLDAKALRLKGGNYVRGPMALMQLKGDLGEHLDRVQAECTMCMLGVALLSRARLFDAVPAAGMQPWGDGAIFDREFIEDHLGDIFDEDTLGLMEVIFEGTVGYGKNATFDDRLAAAEFGRSLGDREPRARAVCNLLIEHDGDLVIPEAAKEARDA